MVDTVIFDFDGVILDSFPDQFKWFSHICGVLGKDFSYSSLDEFRDDYREPVYPNMYNFLGFDWNSEKDTIWSEYNKHKATAQISLFEGIEQVIINLSKKGRTLAIASSNTHEAIHKQLHDHKIDQYFKVIVGKDNLPVENGDPQLKPHPACILLALDKLRCSPGNAIYVGDQPADIIAARNVADYRNHPIPVVAVTYGYSPPKRLLELNPDHMVHRPEELLKILQ